MAFLFLRPFRTISYQSCKNINNFHNNIIIFNVNLDNFNINHYYSRHSTLSQKFSTIIIPVQVGMTKNKSGSFHESIKIITAVFYHLVGQALSLVGSAAVQFALIWWLTQETGSATILATASLVAFLPQVLLGPFAGVLVDRWSRRWTMFLADGGIALATLLLAYLFWTESIQIWHIFALMFVRSLGGAFHGLPCKPRPR